MPPTPRKGFYLLSWHSAELTKLTKKSIDSWWICTRTQKTNTNQTYLTLAKSLHCSLWHSAGNPLLQQTRSGKGQEANIYVFPSQSLHNCSPGSLQHAWCSQTHYTADTKCEGMLVSQWDFMDPEMSISYNFQVSWSIMLFISVHLKMQKM